MNTEMQINYTETQSVNANAILAADSQGEYIATLADCVQEYDVQIANATNEMQEIAQEKSDTRVDQSEVNSFLNRDKTTDEETGEEYVTVNIKELTQLSLMAENYGMSMGTVSGSLLKPEVKVSVLEELAAKQQSKLDDLNSSSELKMISFQALMDSRKQALLQLSNLYSSSNEITMEIIRNMK